MRKVNFDMSTNYKVKSRDHFTKTAMASSRLLCSTLLGALGARAQGPHCDAPIARATHAETPFALQAQGLGEVASNPTERNIPLRIKKGTLGPQPPLIL